MALEAAQILHLVDSHGGGLEVLTFSPVAHDDAYGVILAPVAYEESLEEGVGDCDFVLPDGAEMIV